MITHATLMEELRYDPGTGEFAWRKTKSGRRLKPGSIFSDGYHLICINGRQYQAHRLAWLYMHGWLPSGDIDHRNRIRADNRIKNLRPATKVQNAHNTSLPKDNTSGARGVRFKKNRWEVSCMVSGIRHYLGRFKTREEATRKYDDFAFSHVGEFSSPSVGSREPHYI